MTNTTKVLRNIPGMEIVGRGVYLRPHQPYELKEVLFKRGKARKYYSAETDQTFSIAEGYEVNDNPPMPTGQTLNQVSIEESFERFDNQFSLDASLAVSNGLFSIDANASQSKQMRSEEDAYYATRSSFIPLWTVFLPSAAGFSEDTFEIDIPVPFKHADRKKYEKFFARYGTHYATRVWVGGKAVLAFTVAKSSEMTKAQIQAGIKASYGGLGSSQIETDMKKDKEELQKNSDCTVSGKGGDELKLAMLSSLDAQSYNEWLATVKANPQAIEIEVAGIWTLVSDEAKAKALQDAYKTATTFTPISAGFKIDDVLYFLTGNKYFCYHIEDGKSVKPKPISEKWPFLSKLGIERIDAALKGDDLFSAEGEDLNRKLFFFFKDRYIRVDIETNQVDDGYPKRISDGWPGVAFECIDACVNAGPNSVYFFAGNHYCRYNTLEHRVDDGYPEPINQRWAGVTFDRIDAAICWGDSKVYFFRGDQHIRYDMVIYRSDPGYPKEITGSYVEDWKFFD